MNTGLNMCGTGVPPVMEAGLPGPVRRSGIGLPPDA
jgi:hypothetical protein